MAFKDKEQITIFLTTNCNLNCSYCYMPKIEIAEDDRYIDFEFAKLGIIDFFSKSNSRTIRFFSSGEPTLAFNLMQKIYDFAFNLVGDTLKIELETNGFFNDEVSRWVENHVDYLWISFDGFPEIQNSQRPTIQNKRSSELVLKNIRRFVKTKKNQFGIRATVTKKYITEQIKLIEYFYSLGIKYVSASPVYYSKVNPTADTTSLLEFAQSYVPAYFRALELGMFYQTLLMVNFEEETDIYCQTSIPTPRLTTDGYVSSCDWASLGNKYLPHKIKQELIYGFYDKELKKIIYDEEKIRRIMKRTVSFLSENFCRNCKAIKYCAGGCIGKMSAVTNDLYKATDDWCMAVNYLFERLPINVKYPYIHP